MGERRRWHPAVVQAAVRILIAGAQAAASTGDRRNERARDVAKVDGGATRTSGARAAVLVRALEVEAKHPFGVELPILPELSAADHAVHFVLRVACAGRPCVGEPRGACRASPGECRGCD